MYEYACWSLYNSMHSGFVFLHLSVVCLGTFCSSRMHKLCKRNCQSRGNPISHTPKLSCIGDMKNKTLELSPYNMHTLGCKCGHKVFAQLYTHDFARNDNNAKKDTSLLKSWKNLIDMNKSYTQILCIYAFPHTNLMHKLIHSRQGRAFSPHTHTNLMHIRIHSRQGRAL